MPTIPIMKTIGEISQKTGLPYEFIRKLCLQEKIVFIKSGKKYLINFEKFIEYLNMGEQHEEQDPHSY